MTIQISIRIAQDNICSEISTNIVCRQELGDDWTSNFSYYHEAGSEKSQVALSKKVADSSWFSKSREHTVLILIPGIFAILLLFSHSDMINSLLLPAINNIAVYCDVLGILSGFRER